LGLTGKPQLPELFSTVAKFFLRCVVLCSRLRSIGSPFLARFEDALSALAREVNTFWHAD